MADYIYSKHVDITTTGGAGSATGSGTIQEINGFLLDIFLDWHASAPATSVVKITDEKSQELLDAPAGNTDIRYAPRKEVVSDHGVATGFYEMHPLNGTLTVIVTLSNALTDCLIATIRYLKTYRFDGQDA